MSDEFLIACVPVVGAITTLLLRRALMIWSSTRLKASVIRKEIADRQHADNARVVDLMIAQAREDAKVATELARLSEKIDSAVSARRRAEDTVDDAFALISARLEKIEDFAKEFAEFRKQIAYRKRD